MRRMRRTSKTVRKIVAGVAGGKEVVDGRPRSRVGCGPDNGRDVGRSGDVVVEVADIDAAVAAGVDVVVIVVSAVPVAAGVSGSASLLGCCCCPWQGLVKER